MPKLYFTVGMPRCGKSTLAGKWLNKQCKIITKYDNTGIFEFGWTPGQLAQEKRVVVCGDDFRLALHGDVYHWETEGFVGATVFAAIRALLRTGHDVLFDETNSSEFSIRRIMEIDSQALPVHINIPLQTCIERAKATKQDYLIPTIERIDRNIQKLDIEAIRSEYTHS